MLVLHFFSLALSHHTHTHTHTHIHTHTNKQQVPPVATTAFPMDVDEERGGASDSSDMEVEVVVGPSPIRKSRRLQSQPPPLPPIRSRHFGPLGAPQRRALYIRLSEAAEWWFTEGRPEYERLLAAAKGKPVGRPGGPVLIPGSSEGGYDSDWFMVNLWGLCDKNYLDDNVIYAFCKLLERRDAEVEGRCNLYVSTTFMDKLLHDKGRYCYGKVKKWYTKDKKNGLFAYDKVFIPINKTVGSYMHWTLLVLYPKEKTMQYFNSLNEKDNGTKYFEIIKKYLSEHHADTGQEGRFSATSWETVHSSPETVPQQINGYDCGCFVLGYMYMLSQGLSIAEVTQEKMLAFRERIAMGILDKRFHNL
jgi:hypothetical protein